MLVRMSSSRKALADADKLTNSGLAKTLFPADWKRDRPRPSVYLLAHDGQAPQIHAEHTAAAGLNLPNWFEHFELGALPNVGREMAPTGGHFSFRDSQHAELIFADRAELEVFVAAHRALFLSTVSVGKDVVYSYIQGRVAAGDAEWNSFFADSGVASGIGPKWSRKLELGLYEHASPSS